MKSIIKSLGIIAFVAIIGFSLVSCGGSGGGGSPTPNLTNPSVSFPTSASAIGDFDTDDPLFENLKPMTEAQFKTFVDELIKELDGTSISGLLSYASRFSSGRAAQTETLNANLADELGKPFSGWIKGSVTFDEDDGTGSVNVTGMARYDTSELEDGYDILEDGTYVIGVAFADFTVNVGVGEDMMAYGSIKIPTIAQGMGGRPAGFGFNIASEDMWVKLLGKVSINLALTGEYTQSISIQAFGEDNGSLGNINIVAKYTEKDGYVYTVNDKTVTFSF